VLLRGFDFQGGLSKDLDEEEEGRKERKERKKNPRFFSFYKTTQFFFLFS